MVYRIYKDKKLICASEDKRKAFKVMRESFEPGARYDVETEENGVKNREQYYPTVRTDGRISFNKQSSTKNNYDRYVKEGKVKNVTVKFNSEQYAMLEKAAELNNVSVFTFVKNAVLEKLKE